MSFLSGLIQQASYSEGDALTVGDVFLAEWLEDFVGKQVYVAWMFGGEPITEEQVLDIAILTAEGLVDAELGATYSEATGFLWVDEKGVVGGRDLIKIFDSHEGQYGALIIQETPIDFSESALALQSAQAEIEKLKQHIVEQKKQSQATESATTYLRYRVNEAIKLLAAVSDRKWVIERPPAPQRELHLNCPNGHTAAFSMTPEITIPPEKATDVFVVACRECGARFQGKFEQSFRLYASETIVGIKNDFQGEYLTFSSVEVLK